MTNGSASNGMGASARRREASATVRRWKLSMRTSQEPPHCEVCAWWPPPILDGAYTLMNAHHIVPVAAGGNDDPSNLIILCPNDHALAHRAFPMRRGVYRGPREREAFVNALGELCHPQEHERKLWEAAIAREARRLGFVRRTSPHRRGR